MQHLGNLWPVIAEPKIAASQLGSDLSLDMAIVGGGFTGCSAALEGARRGASVGLFEAETFGHGGSGRNVGLVNAGLWLPPQTILDTMGEAPGRKLMDALAVAPALVWSLIEREAIDCEATPNGTLHLAHSPAGLRNLNERYGQARSLNWPVSLLDADETARRTGSNSFHGALFDPRAGTINPLAYARGLARAAAKAGARIYERSRTTTISREGDLWTLTVNGYTVRAKSLLLATNAYFSGIQMSFRPQIVAMSYFQLATVPMPKKLRDVILPGGEGCWDTGLIMSSFRLDRAGRMIVGGIGDLEGKAQPIHAAWARRKLRRTFPELGDLPFEHAWSGRIAMTHDHIPKIVRFGPDAYACFGYSGRGIGPATAFGMQSAIALLEENEDALPVAAVNDHQEVFVSAKEAFFATGSALSHAVNPLPFR